MFSQLNLRNLFPFVLENYFLLFHTTDHLTVVAAKRNSIN